MKGKKGDIGRMDEDSVMGSKDPKLASNADVASFWLHNTHLTELRKKNKIFKSLTSSKGLGHTFHPGLQRAAINQTKIPTTVCGSLVTPAFVKTLYQLSRHCPSCHCHSQPVCGDTVLVRTKQTKLHVIIRSKYGRKKRI